MDKKEKKKDLIGKEEMSYKRHLETSFTKKHCSLLGQAHKVTKKQDKILASLTSFCVCLLCLKTLS
jgi:hypothetical protein